jgi:hypothetical protein
METISQSPEMKFSADFHFYFCIFTLHCRHDEASFLGRENVGHRL